MANSRTLRGVGVRSAEPRRGIAADILVLPLDGRVPGFRATCRDISHDGVFVASTRSLPLDSLVVLKITIGKLILELTAQIIHAIAGHGFGCQFLDVGEADLRSLSLLVAASRAAPPRMRTIRPRMTRRNESSDAITRPRWRVA